ncbi:hypothetical protein AN963_26125 [Brevibacillus choshinensis]|uniref:YgxA-like substrate binding domain-containing protein n=1 Tax=Brevibacillus choshinensis TaxID=54911 RepID=A0ABR5N2T8_BRECH|nr:nucleotidyltransferase-like protein [Brevibacillus choshinensis]KQL44823.1 hypothetical protein AN963_26125 [Brevibacillus choshinensis]
MNMRPEESQQTYLELLQKRLDVQAVLMLPDFPSREGTYYLIVAKQPEIDGTIRRVLFQDQSIMEQWISMWQLEKGTIYGLDEKLAHMLARAEILIDKADYMRQIKQRLLRITDSLQKKLICREYSHLVLFFHEAKEWLQQGLTLDAYHAFVQALHAWARLIAYEMGEHPQAALWVQVKRLDSSVYRLYEELSMNAETLEKRIELLVLAIEFAVTSRMKESVRYLMELMETKVGPWRLQELMNHPAVQAADIQIPSLIDKMVQRSFIQEVVCAGSEAGEQETCFILLG